MTPEESFELEKKKGYMVVKGNDLIQKNRFALSLTERTDKHFPRGHCSQQKRVSRVNAAVYDRP